MTNFLALWIYVTARNKNLVIVGNILETQNLLGSYTKLSQVYDELMEEDGSIRSKYSFLVKSFQEMGATELNRRALDADRILQENGVTYNIYGESERLERTWSLDLFPILMDSDEWRKLERGLDQRGELLDSILKDLYGPRRMIFEKRIPPELVYGCPGFLRPCHGMFHDAGLSYFATDLVRDQHGDFYVLNDRIQAPSGSGYSLENRIVLSRIFPSIYRDSQVHRVASYFRALRKNLLSLSGIQGKDPVIVLLTPGPGNETFFEHAYLASYLGYTLVQGDDLTVRGNKVYMKTVEGLQKVDLILKRLDDDFMDALELRGDSLLGVPGLLESVRSGNVKVANPIGGAVLENRAFMPFMNELCRMYLGEELILPMVPSHWLGNPDELALVLNELDKFILKPVYPTTLEHSHAPVEMGKSEKSQLITKLRTNPGGWVAQEILNSSTIPVLTQNGLVPGKAIYRTFVTMADGGFQTMAGGLVRVTTDLQEMFITNQRGAFSKDLWVLASEAQKEESVPLPTSETISVSRAAVGVPSRVADNLFWFARYSERSENTARFLREAINGVLQLNEGLDLKSLQGTLKMLTQVTSTYPGFIGDDSFELLNQPFPELQRLMYSESYSGSVVFNLAALSNSAKNVRDRFSDDTRKIIKSLELKKSSSDKNYDLILEDIFQTIILLTSLTGLSFENLSREAGWYFLEIGRRIERANNLIQTMQSMINLELHTDKNILETALSLNDIRITYRRRYRHKIEVGPVFDILLFDDSNPRSLGYQMEQLKNNIHLLPSKEPKKTYPEDRIVLDIFTTYKMKDISLLVRGGDLDIQMTTEWLDELKLKLRNLSEAITGRYFNYAESQTSLGG